MATQSKDVEMKEVSGEGEQREAEGEPDKKQVKKDKDLLTFEGQYAVVWGLINAHHSILPLNIQCIFTHATKFTFEVCVILFHLRYALHGMIFGEAEKERAA